MLYHKGVNLYLQLLHQGTHNIVTEVIQLHVGHLVEGGLLNVDDAHPSAPLISEQRYIG